MKTKYIVVMMCALFLMVPVAFAQISGAGTTAGVSEGASGSSAGNVTIVGGNVTQVNVSGTTITSNWAGFFGEVAGGVQLGDASSNVFYEWTVSDITGAVVYAVNTTWNINTGSMQAAVATDLPSYVQGSGTDNFTNTFNVSETFANSSAIGSIASTPTAYTWQNGTQGAQLRTYALYDSADAVYVMAAVADADVVAFDNSTTVDYQMLVPADASGQQYFFYLELP